MNTATAMLFNLALKSTVVLLAAFAATLAFRRASASSRRLLWILAAACLLALPILSQVVPALKIQPPPITRAISYIPTPTPASVVVIPGIAYLPTTKPTPRQIPWLTLFWIGGIVAVTGHLAIGMARMHWLARRATRIQPPEEAIQLAATLGIARVEFLESDRIAMPLTWGIFRPKILLPANRTNWPADRIHLVFAHELIHVQQHDCFFQLLMQLTCAIYWFHPLAWFSAAQFRRERERACDDGVLRLGINGPEYAGHLLELVRILKPKPRPSLAVAMAHQSNLETRLTALLDTRINRAKISARATIAAALVAVCLLLPLASVRAQAPDAQPSISGFVYDASGAVIPRAAVQATNLETHTKATALTGLAGEYALSLSPGKYALEISTPGFRVFRRDNVNVSSGNQRVDAILELGAISERLEVIGQKPEGQVARSVVPRRIRVGGSVIAAKLVSKVAPMYPEQARQLGIEGAVLLQAIISKDGSVLSLTVVTTADPDLAKAAMAAVQQWHYQPTLLNGEPVEVVTTITVDFKLN